MKTDGTQAKINKRITLVVVIAAALLVVGIALALLIPYFVGRRVDYLRDDLSKYISIPEEKYGEFTLNIKIAPPKEFEIDELIMAEQIKYKTLSGLGEYQREGEIGVGDLLLLRYYAFTEDGAVAGASNLLGESEDYTVGAGFYLMGDRIVGLDQGILGKRVEGYSNIGTAGVVSDGCVVYISYEMTDGESITTVKDARIDLSDSALDEKMGEGFREYLIGKTVGATSTERLTVTLGGASVTYYAVKISATGLPLTVEGLLPYDYSDPSMAGETVSFDLYIDKIVDYNVPTVDEEFITHKLGLKDKLESGYSEGTLYEKYRLYLEEQLHQEYLELKAILTEEALWQYLSSSATVIKLPKNEVEAQYDSYYSELRFEYESLGGSMALGEFARIYLGLSESADWEGYLRSISEESVKQKLVFFYVIRESGLIPSGDALTECREDALENYITSELLSLGVDESDFKTKEEYAEYRAGIKAELIESLGEEYFDELAYSVWGVEKLLERATVKETP